MDKQLKNMLLCTGFGVTLFALLMHLDAVGGLLMKLLAALQPLLVGGVIAFVLNVPMVKIEALLDRFFKPRKPAKAARPHRAAALGLTVLLLVFLLVVIVLVVVPQFIASFSEGLRLFQASAPKLETAIRGLGLDADWLHQFDVSTLKSEGSLLQQLTSGVGQAGSALLGTVTSVAGQLFNLLLAVVFTAYFLLEKEMLARQTRWLLDRICPPKAEEKLLLVADRLRTTYASFLGGQCTEACILGLMMFTGFSLFRLPYAGLVAVLTAVTSLVPYVGSFISCATAVLLTLLVNPLQALLTFAVYQTVQFIENQFVYPRVVGNAVGLPPLYTILAVFLGGTLFGVVGMIFFIPLMATVYSLLHDLQSTEAADGTPPPDQTATP